MVTNQNEKIKDMNDDHVGDWIPCPRCSSKRVAQSKKEEWCAYLAMAGLLIMFGVQDFETGVIIGLLLAGSILMFRHCKGTIWKCLDCKNRFLHKNPDRKEEETNPVKVIISWFKKDIKKAADYRAAKREAKKVEYGNKDEAQSSTN